MFFYVSGQKSVQSTGGKKYTLLVRDDFTKLKAVHFMRSKDEVTKYFSQYLADYRFTGVTIYWRITWYYNDRIGE